MPTCIQTLDALNYTSTLCIRRLPMSHVTSLALPGCPECRPELIAYNHHSFSTYCYTCLLPGIETGTGLDMEATPRHTYASTYHSSTHMCLNISLLNTYASTYLSSTHMCLNTSLLNTHASTYQYICQCSCVARRLVLAHTA